MEIGMNAPELKNVGEIDRKTYLGSSDIAAVMGLGAYGRSAYTTYCAKIGEPVTEMDAGDRKFLERRKRWEGPIVEMLREEFGGEIAGINQRYIDPEYDFMASEIDAEWIDADGATQNIEIKTVSPFAFGERFGWGEAGTSDVPVHYAAQVMYGLMITGRQTCIVAAMVGLDNMIFYRIERDEETIAAMRAAAVDFWTNHVLARIPPDPQTTRDMKLIMDRIGGRPVELDAPTLVKLDQLREARDTVRMLNGDGGAIESLSFDIGAFVLTAWGYPMDAAPVVQDNAILNFGGKKVATWNRTRGTFLDQKRLKSEQPQIVRDYTKEHWYRVLRFPKQP
jgi:predicted phage-related endonuclease